MTIKQTSPWRWRHYGSLKRRYSTKTLHGVTNKNISTWNTLAWRWRQHGHLKRW